MYALGLTWVILEPVNLGHASQLLSGLFFFFHGGVKGINKINFVEQYKHYKWIPVIYFVIAVFDVFTNDFSYSPYIHELGCIVGIVAVVNISARLMEKDMVKIHPLLSGSSFIILALHIRVKGYLSFFMIKILCINSPIYLLIYYIVISLATVAICVCICAFIKRFTPFLLKPLTGGR